MYVGTLKEVCEGNWCADSYSYTHTHTHSPVASHLMAVIVAIFEYRLNICYKPESLDFLDTAEN